MGRSLYPTMTTMMSALLALGVLGLPGCERGPEANPDIETRVGLEADAPECGMGFEESVTVTCEGPEGELSELGALCGYSSRPTVFDTDPGDAVLVMGPTLGPKLVVHAIVPSTRHDQTETVKYAAFVHTGVATNPAQNWEQGDPVSGTITTFRALLHACTVCTWNAVGTLTWRNTTLTFQFGASGPPC